MMMQVDYPIVAWTKLVLCGRQVQKDGVGRGRLPIAQEFGGLCTGSLIYAQMLGEATVIRL